MSPRRRAEEQSPAAALASLRRGEAAPVYLLHGPEAFLRDQLIRAIRRAVLGERPGDFNHDRFDWPDAKAADVAAAAQTLPFMATRRLVEVRGFEQVREEEAAILLPLLEAPPPTAVLLFTAERADMRQTIFRRMAEAGLALRLEAPSERELPAWVRTQAEGLGFALGPEGAHLLVEMVEPSLGRLRAELEKLAAYLGPGGAAGEEEVREVVGRSKVEAMYKLGDSLASGDTRRALDHLRRLAETEPPQVLLGMLRNQVRRWVVAKALLSQEKRPGELPSLMGVSPFAAERLARQVGGATARFLRALYKKLLAADRRIKRTSEPRRAFQALEIFAMEMDQEPDGFARGRRRAATRAADAPGRR